MLGNLGFLQLAGAPFWCRFCTFSRRKRDQNIWVLFGEKHSTCEMLKQMNAGSERDAVLLNACEWIQARNVHVTGEIFSCSIANKNLDVKLL